MSVDLWWDEGKDYAALYAGCLDTQLALLNKRSKWWDAWSPMPGVRAKKQYAPLDEQKADIEAQVGRWFDLATTSRLETSWGAE